MLQEFVFTLRIFYDGLLTSVNPAASSARRIRPIVAMQVLPKEASMASKRNQERVRYLDEQLSVVMNKLGLELSALRKEFPRPLTVQQDLYRKFADSIARAIIRWDDAHVGRVAMCGVGSDHTPRRVSLASVHGYEQWHPIDASGPEIVRRTAVTALVARLADRLYLKD